MRPWFKRPLFALAGIALLASSLSACSHRAGHGWSDDRVAEMRAQAVERIGRKLDLTEAQKLKLGVLADELLAQRRAMRGEGAEPRAALQALIATDKFDRAGAQALFDQKTQALQAGAPRVMTALADFYDSLDTRQQQQVRERLQHRHHGWWRG